MFESCGGLVMLVCSLSVVCFRFCCCCFWVCDDVVGCVGDGW